ncbi:TPA: aldo/keto reductase [Candidatus Poribacteria bacterium]|nr:aldo/keto reductase [Candidatus Poribacteria bacterium]HIO46343.1 aldo/keto reductase [Candidatus Poribacteria bacterium]
MTYDIPQITLGRTGLKVTRLGIGGGYCESVDGYRTALDCGVNYMDTARNYRDGEDEKVIGQAIQGRRDQLILATKTAARRAEGVRKDLETSLSLLKTEYIDIYQLHHLNTPVEREQALSSGGAVEAAQKAQEEGLIRFIGVTGHDWEQIGQAVATGLFDTVLCWYNCAMKEPEEAIFPQALDLNVGVVIMNASRNDRLFSQTGTPPEEHFYRYVLNHPAVHLTIMGLRSTERFDRIASCLSDKVELINQEESKLEIYGSQMREQGKLN